MPVGRKENVNNGPRGRDRGLASSWPRDATGPADAASIEARPQPSEWRRQVGVLVYIVLTVLIFGLLGLVQKLVEGL